ncbi:TrbI/VirB10 family protein [Sphingomonas panni]
MLGGVAAVALVAASFYILPGSDPKDHSADTSEEVKVSTKDMMNRNLSEQEWMALSENRFDSTENQLKGINGTNHRVDQLSEQIEQLKSQNQSMASDGQRVVSAYQTENEQLRRQINERASAPPAPGPAAMYGPAGTALYQRPEGAGGAQVPQAPAAARLSEVKMVSFQTAGGTATQVEKGNTVYTDSPNYLPPNSFATARVIVGVDAAAGSRARPIRCPSYCASPALPVRCFRTASCSRPGSRAALINGAARGELSSEKVYVKLQKMTCPQPGGRYAVSEVKGFIAFGGKTGVRGRVVSREGSLVGQAFLAGLVGGIGRGFATNTNLALQPGNVVVGGKRQQLGMGDIAQGGLGNGVAESGDMVSKYLIERAEQSSARHRDADQSRCRDRFPGGCSCP